jgi:hypothetical protein
MFDNGASQIIEITNQMPGRIRINIVVKRHLFAGK